ncbi:peptidylprolyl isomerase [Geomonas sp.]|uniref:peptidylprolyl isomerase n=1 Tax=Geomonas sp. TaxID=2651584 RepID=UPI002B4A360A|nr:peptidylprolyl isomerase [Geomonas sp.]HJV34823.1 peptidylprolyl isomerase [Geomonas sp.]
MGKFFTGIILFALLALQPITSPAAQVIDGIAATVNDEVITTAEVDKEYSQLQREAEKLPASAKMGLRNTALNRLIDKKLIDQKVKELDIKVSDEEIRGTIEDVKKQNNLTQEALLQALAGQGLSYEQYKAQLKEQLERMRLMGQEVRSKIQVGEREMREYYEANKAKYGFDQQFKARHIFFKLDKNAPPAEVAKAEAAANEVLKEARSGKDFAELAKKYSGDPTTAKEGGDLGSFKRSEMLPEIGDTVAAMKPGEISSVVRSPAGLHIIKLEEKTETVGKPYDEVKAEIEEALYKKKSDERFSQWVKDLHSSAAIDIRATP